MLLALAAPSPGRTADVVRDHGIEIGLVAGPRTVEGSWQAGLSLRLEPGWMTYWRNPGEAGVAPRFDWNASDNLKGVAVRWPAPRRFDEAGTGTIGYDGDVTLPLAVTPADPSRPVRLRLAFSYGVCRDLCVPGTAGLDLTLDPARPAGRLPELDAAAAAVPRPAALGAAGPLAVTAVRRDVGPAPRLVVEVRAPAGADLFVETPPDWFLGLPTPLGDGPDGSRRFALPLDGVPNGASPVGAPLTLTLVAGSAAVETAVTVP